MIVTGIKVNRTRKKVAWGKAGLAFMSVLSLFLILKEPSLSIDYVERGMKLCITTVIPSLFPFMVVSELIVLCGAAEFIGRPLDRLSRALFGVSGEGASALVLGTVCGFPVGTRVALSLFREERISYGELLRLICFSNNPSSAFVISAVGSTLFGSHRFGVALYFITLASSFLVGIGQNILLGRGKGFSQRVTSVAEKKENKGISTFPDAVSSSAFAMLKICAFVVFFSTFTGVFDTLLSSFHLSQTVKAALFSFFELNCGVYAAAGIKDTLAATLVAAFAVGWSGLSVHFQMVGICEGIDLPFRRYFFAKLCQGLINVLLMGVYFRIFRENIVFDAESVGAFLVYDTSLSPLVISVLACFFVCVAVGTFWRIKRR